MAEKIKDPGIGISSDEQAQRFISPDGSFNIKHVNRPTSLSESYSYLISISWFRFFCWVVAGYVVVNSFFAIIYTILGISNIAEPESHIFKDFLNAFFFSAQTITTVGYGAMAPKGFLFGLISSFEALIGLLSFSFITGLLYGRFSRPKSNIRFSDFMVYRDHKGQNSIMFRLLSKGTSVMIYPKIEVTLALSEKGADGNYANNFYRLKLERDKITYLPTTWTLVHVIEESSPLFGTTKEELVNLQGEVLIMASYYNESFNQEVYQAHSYLLKNVRLDQAFVKAFHYDEDGYTVLDHDKLDVTRSHNT